MRVARADSADFFYDQQQLDALVLPNYCRWILAPFRGHLRGRMLEVGAGTGSFAEAYVDDVDEAVLVEPAANLLGKLAERFARKSWVHPLLGTLEQHAGRRVGACDLTEGSFDAAAIVNVLEHVPDDLRLAETIFRTLRPGGALLVFVPAHAWLYGSLDAVVRHLRRYTRASLENLLGAAGFAIETIRYVDALGVVPWFVAGRVLRMRRFNATAASTYDRLGVPLAAWSERRVSLPFGKSLLCIARRPCEGKVAS